MRKNINLKLFITVFTFSLIIMSCTNSGNTENNTEDPTISSNSEALEEVLPNPDYDFDNCPKAWSLEEITAAPDSFCTLALLGDAQKLTEFPEILSNMPYLRSIDASSNNINDIPKFLSKLRELDLSTNMLDKCPSGLENLKNLIILKLSYNSIKEIDKSVFDMKNLEELWMSSNSLNEIPVQLCSLTKLRVLSFSENNITTIPAEIGQLTNLEALYLNDQKIESLPKELGNLKKLNTLYIGSDYSGGSKNNTFTTIPACIFELKALKDLSLSYGNISEISSDIKKLSNLETLYLSGNKLSSLPEEIKSLKNLKNLYLGENNFSKDQETKIRSWFGNDVNIEFEVEYAD